MAVGNYEHSSKMPQRLFRIHDTTWGGNFCCFSDAFNFAIRQLFQMTLHKLKS